MSIAIALRAESLKMKRTSSYYLPLLLAAVVPFMTLFFDNQSPESRVELNVDPWRLYFSDARMPLNFLFLPLFVMLACTLPPQMEYRNSTWKQVLASPLSRTRIYVAKFIVVMIQTVLFLFFYHLLMAFGLVIFAYLHPEIDIWKKGPDLLQMTRDTAYSLAAVLPIAALQFWLGLRYKSFLVPVGVGFVLWLASSMMVLEYDMDGRWLPYAYPVLVSSVKAKAAFPALVPAALGIAGTVFLLGGLWFRRGRLH